MGAPGHDEKTGSQQGERKGELDPQRRVPRSEADPEHAHQGRQHDDQQGIDLLQPTGGKLPGEDHQVGVLLGEEIHAGSGLLEAGPEDCGPDEEDEDEAHPASFQAVSAGEQDHVAEVEDGQNRNREGDGSSHGLDGERQKPGRGQSGESQCCGGRHSQAPQEQAAGPGPRLEAGRIPLEFTGPGQMAPAQHVLQHGEGHSHTGGAEAQMPVHLFAQEGADPGSQKGSDVDSHVENGEAGVPPRVVARVEVAHDSADVGLEEARADGHQSQADVEGEFGRDSQRVVAGGDDDPAHQDGAPLADEPVRHPSSGESQCVDGEGVQAVDGARFGRAHSHAPAGGVDHEQDQERSHAVIAEALPHLGEEEGREPPGMTEKGLLPAAAAGCLRWVHGGLHTHVFEINEPRWDSPEIRWLPSGAEERR